MEQVAAGPRDMKDKWTRKAHSPSRNETIVYQEDRLVYTTCPNDGEEEALGEEVVEEDQEEEEEDLIQII